MLVCKALFGSLGEIVSCGGNIVLHCAKNLLQLGKVLLPLVILRIEIPFHGFECTNASGIVLTALL